MSLPTQIEKDFHVHLHGCLDPQDLWSMGKDLWQDRQDKLAWYAQEFEKATGRKPDVASYWQDQDGQAILAQDFLCLEPTTFAVFQAKFNLIIALCPILLSNISTQEYIIRKVAKTSGLIYFEARTLIPFYYTATDAARYLFILCQSIKKLNCELAMQTKLVFSLFREPKLALLHYEWLREFCRQEPKLAEVIVGIDFAYDEIAYPPKTRATLMAKFREDNERERPLELLCHVGEVFASVSSACRWILETFQQGVWRLGHATGLGIDPANFLGHLIQESEEEIADHQIWLAQNKELLREHGYCADFTPVQVYDEESIASARSLQQAVASILKQHGATIESCPTSNLRLGQIRELSYHPLKFFAQQGLSVHICTDDPGIFATSWQEELALARKII